MTPMTRRAGEAPGLADPEARPPTLDELPLELEDAPEVDEIPLVGGEAGEIEVLPLAEEAPPLLPLGGAGAARQAGLTLRHLYAATEAALVLSGLGGHAEDICARLRARAGRVVKLEVIDLSLLWFALGAQRHTAAAQAGRALLHLSLYARGQWGAWLAAPADARIAIGLALEEPWDVRRVMGEMERQVEARLRRPVGRRAPGRRQASDGRPGLTKAERWIRVAAVAVLCGVLLHWAGALLPARRVTPPTVASLTLPGLQDR